MIGLDIYRIAEILGQILTFCGVLVIVFGVCVASVYFVQTWLKQEKFSNLYQEYRKNMSRAILLGLEFLVAGDIIRSVTGTPTFVSVGVLALLVLIRSFLGITFDMEIEGKWPWQRGRKVSE